MFFYSIKKMVNRWSYLIPPIQLLATFIVSFIDLNNDLYLKLSNLLGYSIFTNILYISFYFKKGYCLFTKTSVIGLLLISVLNFFSSIFLAENSYYIYDRIFSQTITTTIIILTLILLCKSTNTSTK